MINSEPSGNVLPPNDAELLSELRQHIANDAVASSLAYSNLVVFVAVLFCFTGLSTPAAITYVVVSFALCSASVLIALFCHRFSLFPWCGYMVVASTVINDLTIPLVLVFDYFAPERANTLSAVVIVAGVSFVSVHLVARFTTAMLTAKVITIGMCCVFLLRMPTSPVNVTEIITLLVLSCLIMLSTGYWIILRRKQEIRLQLQLQAASAVTSQQNQKLEVALEENRKTNTRLEDEFALRQKLVSHIGHDLRQPISAAVYTLMQLAKNEQNNDRSRLIADTSECVNSASRMIEDIVQFTHFDNLSIEVVPEEVQVNDVLQQIQREFQTQAAAALCTMRIVDTSVSVRTDPDLLRRILRNLTMNVIKHSDATKMLLGVRRKSNGIEIWVVDNGCGLDGRKSHLSTNTMQNTHTGLGLGLKISSQLAGACGSELTFASTPGEGTICKLLINPLEAPESKPHSVTVPLDLTSNQETTDNNFAKNQIDSE